jgi:hypothetical protein
MTERSIFGSLLKELGFSERSRLHVWLRWMKESDPMAFLQWDILKEDISTVEEFRELINCGSASSMSEGTAERFAYLRRLSAASSERDMETK